MTPINTNPDGRIPGKLLSVMVGQSIAHYRISFKLGEGGMGAVYRATDAKLGREVAIKVLPESFAQDRERLVRFEREAKALAALNHPNIAGIYGLEQSGDTQALILELVDGEDLSARLKQGPLPVEEVLGICKQITEALEAAHEKGIIHRDLKPGNVKITPDGKVKVLDFGLAKTAGTVSARSNPDAPTLLAETTTPGAVMGTPAYMSPEQARGKVVDKRTDIWAFGAILFEMLTGRRPFEGDDLTAILARVIERDPDWSRLPASTPSSLRRLLMKCLVKDPTTRLRDIGAARFVVEELISGRTDAPSTASALLGIERLSRLPWILAATCVATFLAAVIFTVTLLRKQPSPSLPVEFTITAPEGAEFNPNGSTISLSDDGRELAFVASSKGTSMLWWRNLASSTPRLLPGTEDASYPFWSPDKKFIAFFSAGKLRKITVAGGPSIALADVTLGRGGTWSRDNIIVFAAGAGDPLSKVNAGGGAVSAVTSLDPPGFQSHRFPRFLPDGRHFLYWAGQGNRPSELRVGSIDSRDKRTLWPSDSGGIYGLRHVFYKAGERTLMARPFDATLLTASGDAFAVDTIPGRSQTASSGEFSVTSVGTIAYSRGEVPLRTLTWIDRSGKTLSTLGEPRRYGSLSLSPDERLVAVDGGEDIWIADLAKATFSQLTFGGSASLPIWSPDGTRIAYMQGRPYQMFIKPASGAGAETPLLKTDLNNFPLDWSRDGQSLVFMTTGGNTPDATGGVSSANLWILPMSGTGTPYPFAATRAHEDVGAFSPDNHWLAFTSNEVGGRYEVYVRPFPTGAGQFRVSRDGGSTPMWRGDGREIFFVSRDGMMMAADVTFAPQFAVGAARPLFPVPLRGARRSYAVTRDGAKFLIPVAERGADSVITVVLNWPETLRK